MCSRLRSISAETFTGNGSQHGAKQRTHAATTERARSCRRRADNDESEGADATHGCQSFTTLTLPHSGWNKHHPDYLYLRNCVKHLAWLPARISKLSSCGGQNHAYVAPIGLWKTASRQQAAFGLLLFQRTLPPNRFSRRHFFDLAPWNLTPLFRRFRKFFHFQKCDGQQRKPPP